MIGVTVAFGLALQSMTQEALISEGVRLGRSAFALGTCAAVGYQVDQPRALRWGEDYQHRAVAAGWQADLAVDALESGIEMETADLRPPEIQTDLAEEDLRRLATDFIVTVKARCRRLDAEEPGLIRDLEAGDRNADAKLAIMLRPLDQ